MRLSKIIRKLAFKNKLASCFCFVSFLIILPIDASYSATVTGSFNTTTRAGRRGNNFFVNTYNYDVSTSVPYTAIAPRTVFSRRNGSSNPINVSVTDEQSASLSLASAWNLPINLNFTASNEASTNESFTIAPHTMLNVVFSWVGDKVLPGGTISKQQVNNFTDNNPIGSPTITNIGTGFYSLTGAYDFQETPIEKVPEPLTILGSMTALGAGVVLKKKHSKTSRKQKQLNT